jgi:hypothetical protein
VPAGLTSEALPWILGELLDSETVAAALQDQFYRSAIRIETKMLATAFSN